MRRVLTVVFCGLLSSAEAEVFGEYEWELRRIEDACLLVTYSYTGNSKMQLHNIDGGVTAFIVLSPDLAGSLVDGEYIKAKGMYSNGEPIELGEMFVGGKTPASTDDPEPWTILMFKDATVVVSTPSFTNESLTIYAEGNYLGTFPLENLNTLIMPFSDCK